MIFHDMKENNGKWIEKVKNGGFFRKHFPYYRKVMSFLKIFKGDNIQDNFRL